MRPMNGEGVFLQLSIVLFVLQHHRNVILKVPTGKGAIPSSSQRQIYDCLNKKKNL